MEVIIMANMEKLTTRKTETETTVRDDLNYKEMKTGQILTNKQEEKEVNAQIGKFKQNAVATNPMSGGNGTKTVTTGDHKLESSTPVTRTVNNYVAKNGAYKDPSKSFATKNTTTVQAGEPVKYGAGSSSRGVSSAQETPMETKPLGGMPGKGPMEQSVEDDIFMMEIDTLLEDF